MKPDEANVYQRVKAGVAHPMDRFERVENGFGAGMPDVNYCIARCEGWIEIKAPTEPVRESTALFKSNHPVSIDQANWMLKQHMAGGVSWLFIGSNKRQLLINGSRIAAIGTKINSMTVPQLERIATWRSDLPMRQPELWQDLRHLLSMA